MNQDNNEGHNVVESGNVAEVESPAVGEGPDVKLRPKFGDLLENGWAGEGNPRRIGIFVRTLIRTGRLNPGRYFVMTDGKGDFWEQGAESDHKLTKVGTVVTNETDNIP